MWLCCVICCEIFFSFFWLIFLKLSLLVLCLFLPEVCVFISLRSVVFSDVLIFSFLYWFCNTIEDVACICLSRVSSGMRCIHRVDRHLHLNANFVFGVKRKMQ